MPPRDARDATPSAESPAETASHEVLELLAEGVPMTLVADLLDPAGPPSPVILEEEGLPEEHWWEQDFKPGARKADDAGPADARGEVAPADDDPPDAAGDAPEERDA